MSNETSEYLHQSKNKAKTVYTIFIILDFFSFFFAFFETEETALEAAKTLRATKEYIVKPCFLQNNKVEPKKEVKEAKKEMRKLWS